jgi:hypothetical protein
MRGRIQQDRKINSVQFPRHAAPPETVIGYRQKQRASKDNKKAPLYRSGALCLRMVISIG